MNTYRIHYFGLLAGHRGLADESLTSNVDSARELYEEISAQHGLELPHQNIRAVVNDEMVPWDHPLVDGDEIAFLPPMSGG